MTGNTLRSVIIYHAYFSLQKMNVHTILGKSCQLQELLCVSRCISATCTLKQMMSENEYVCVCASVEERKKESEWTM